MKKNKIAVLLLTITMLCTTMFAGTESALAASVTNTDTAATISEAIEAQNVNTTGADQFINYTASMTTGTENNIVIVPVHISEAGSLIVHLQGIAVGKTVRVSLHGDSAAADSSVIGYPANVSSNSIENELKVKVPAAGTYYLRFKANVSPTAETQSLNFNVKLVPFGATLESGVTITGSSKNAKTLSYYKITVPSDGYITLKMDALEGPTTFNYSLFDSNKKDIYSGTEYIFSTTDYSKTIGVKKGTYYIGVSPQSPTHFTYGITATFHKYSDQSGSSKSKATRIYKGKTAKHGIVAATDSTSKADWYKIVVKSNQKVNVTLTAATAGGSASGGIKFYIYGSSKKFSSSSTNLDQVNTKKTVSLYSSGNNSKLAPGTYYIKVTKYRGGNGKYTIKWV